MRRFTPYELNLLSQFRIDPEGVSDENIPVEFIIGEAEFYERFFMIEKGILIPRVESEFLIDLALKFVSKKLISFGDIGCGSGAIGITFGLELAKRNISNIGHLLDISTKAAELANKNIVRYKSELQGNQIKVLKSDLLKSLSSSTKFDIIFANLPYIPTSRLSSLDKSVIDYEDLSALDGGEDGLRLIRLLLNSASKYLNVDGVILLEVDDTHEVSKTKEFKKEWSIEVQNDFNGKLRYWVCKLK